MATNSLSFTFINADAFNLLYSLYPDGFASNAIAVNSEGNIYNVDSFNNQVEEVSSNGSFITAFGPFNNLSSIAIDSQDNFYIIDQAKSLVEEFSSNGSFIRAFGSYGSGYGQFMVDFSSINCLGVDSQGNVYVLDIGNNRNRVEKFSNNGSFITAFGSYGSGYGQFGANGMAVTSQGNVYILDAVNSRVEEFSSNGSFITSFGSLNYENLTAIAVDSQDNVYVFGYTENVSSSGSLISISSGVEVFSSNGIFITAFGSYGSGNGQFRISLNMAVDSKDNVYVYDLGVNGQSRLEKFSPTSLINVSLVSGTESEENGKEILDGIIDLGRTDGINSMLEVQGHVEYDNNTVSVNGTVYSLIGTGIFLNAPSQQATPLFTGSFTIDTKTGIASSITNSGNPFVLGGEVNVQFNSLTLNQNGLALGASFQLPQDLNLPNYTFSGADAILISQNDVNFGQSINGTSPDFNDFTLFNLVPGLKFSDFSITYNAPEDQIKIQGKLALSPFVKSADTTLVADLSGDNYIQIEDGESDIKGSLTLTNVKLLAGWSLDKISLNVDTIDETVGGTAEVTFPFGKSIPPKDVSVGLTLGFGLPIPPLQLNTIGVSVGNALNIPIATTGAFLQKISGTIEHLAPSDSQPTDFTGEVDITAGPKVSVDLSKLSLGKFNGPLIDADVTATITKSDLSGNVNLTFVNSQFATINGNFDLNWDKQFLTANGSLKFLNGKITAQGSFKVASNYYDIQMFGSASVIMPKFVPGIGGKPFATANFLFSFTNDNSANNFIAGWTTVGINLLGRNISTTLGFEQFFDGTSQIIHSGNIPALPTANATAASLQTINTDQVISPNLISADQVSSPNLLSAANVTSGNSFAIAPGTPYIILGADWDNPNNNVQLQLQDPNGNIYNESDFAATGNMAIVDQLSQSTSRTVLINNPDPGIWTINVANSTGLGNITYSGSENSQSPTIQVTDPATDTSNQNVTITYNTVDPNPNGKVSLFYNTDNTDYNGILIKGGITEQDGSNSFVWNTQGIAPGNYYVYAMLLDSSNIPVFSYAPGVIDVTEQADLSVTNTASTDQVTLENSLTYTVTVSNNGPNTSQGVVLTDNLPQNVTFVSASVQPSTQSGNNLTFNLGNLENGQSTSINITVNPEAIGDITNTASVTSNTFSGDTSNGSDNFVTTVLNNPTNPNTITNLSGFGSQHWITNNTSLPYTVNFSNKASQGTNPVAQVTITVQIDPNLDLSTFQLSNFGFEGNTYVVPTGVQNYTTQIDLTSTKGILVNVAAGLNTNTRTLTWTFTSIDPTTGQAITDPTKGFLPPEDQSGAGSGYVGYTIQPNANLVDATVINAQASVTFDSQTPNQTPAVLNTVQEKPPSSFVNPLPTTETNPNFTVSWTGSDPDSGIASYNIYVSTNGSQYVLWQNNTTANSATYNGQTGNTYSFYSVATDNVGLTEATHTKADTTTTVNEISSLSLGVNNTLDQSNYFGSLLFNQLSNLGNTVSEVGVFATDDNGDISNPNGSSIPLAPGQTGYAQAVFSESQILYGFDPISLRSNTYSSQNQLFTSHLANFGTQLANGNTLNSLGFYVIVNGTANQELAALSGQISNQPNVFFNITGANNNNLNPLQVIPSTTQTGQYTLAWNGSLGNGSSFTGNLLSINTTPLNNTTDLKQGIVHPIIDTTNGSALQVNFNVTSDAAFNDFVGFYPIASTDGTLENGLKPGQAGYAQAAVSEVISSLQFDRHTGTVTNSAPVYNPADHPWQSTLTDTFAAGQLYAPVLIANGDVQSFLANNPNNNAPTDLSFASVGANPIAYFAFVNANNDGIDHIESLPGYTLGFKDYYGGGDLDYNDMVLNFNPANSSQILSSHAPTY